MEQILCDLPDRLHPVSAYFLDEFLAGRLPVRLFIRYFSLPNSDYADLAYCLAAMFRGLGLP